MCSSVHQHFAINWHSSNYQWSLNTCRRWITIVTASRHLQNQYRIAHPPHLHILLDSVLHYLSFQKIVALGFCFGGCRVERFKEIRSSCIIEELVLKQCLWSFSCLHSTRIVGVFHQCCNSYTEHAHCSVHISLFPFPVFVIQGLHMESVPIIFRLQS